jgi:hypothetical protein
MFQNWNPVGNRVKKWTFSSWIPIGTAKISNWIPTGLQLYWPQRGTHNLHQHIIKLKYIARHQNIPTLLHI